MLINNKEWIRINHFWWIHHKMATRLSLKPEDCIAVVSDLEFGLIIKQNVSVFAPFKRTELGNKRLVHCSFDEYQKFYENKEDTKIKFESIPENNLPF